MKKLTTFFFAFIFFVFQLQAADYFWVGGSGYWSDYANHWATLSGGGTFHTNAPTTDDNVSFDVNSFNSSGETVTIDAVAYCHNMDWIGAGNDPVIAGSSHLHCSGSLTFIADMTLNWSGYMYFESISTGETITSAGHEFRNRVYFDGLGGWEFQDDFQTESSDIIYFYNGSINTNSHSISAYRIISDVTNPRTLTLGSSEIYVYYGSTNAFQINGTNFTLDAGTSHIHLMGNVSGMNISGTGNLNFYDVTGESVTSVNYVYSIGGSFHDISFINHGVLYNNYDINNLTVGGNLTVNHDHTINFVEVMGTGTIKGNSTYGTAIFHGHTSFTGDNTFNTLELFAGKTYTLTYNKTQTITTSLTADGTCSEPIIIKSSSTGNQSHISKDSGSETINYCLLQDQNATGGATFYANNTIDQGNNSGWIIDPPAPQNLYWVGGTGEWNNPAHWSTTTGGGGGACIPSPLDNVYFDANSFSSSGQTVTAIGDGSNDVNCKSMSWNGVTNNPTFTGLNTLYLNVYGSLSLSAAMSFTFAGQIHLHSDNPGNTITTNGQVLNYHNIYFNGVGGGWTLLDDLNMGDEDIFLVNGDLNTNNQTVTARRFMSDYSTARSLTLGSSEIILSYTTSTTMRFGKTNLIFDGGTSLIRFLTGGGSMNCSGSGTMDFHNVICEAATGTSYIINPGGSFNTILYNSHGILDGGNTTVDTVWFTANGTIDDHGNNINYVEINGTASVKADGIYNELILKSNGSITGSNIITTLELTSGNSYTFSYGKTQTILTDFIANGTCTAPIVLQSNNATLQTTISKSSGTITVDYCTLQNMIGDGLAAFIANNSIDMGGNTGWTINPATPQNLYWVGGNGTWDDPDNWSFTSGGAPGACVPTSVDNVFFDTNSFDAAGQVVTLIGDGSNNVNCHHMDWTDVTNTPSLSGANTLNLRIYGSMILDPNMTFNFAGKIYFNSTNTGNLIQTEGHVLNLHDMHFDGVGGEWSLMEPMDLGDEDIYLHNGSLFTNSHNLSCRRFLSQYTTARTLDLGTSEFILNYSSNGAINITGTNFTLNASNSTVRLISPGGGIYTNGALTLNDVLCEAATGSNIISNDDGFINNVIFNSNGTIDDRVTVDSVIVAGNLSVNDNNNFNYVLVNGTGSIGGSGTYGKLILKENASISGNNVLDTLELTAGKAYTFSYGKQQTFNYELIAEGTPTELIVIQSSTAGNQTTFSKPSGNNVVVNYVSLQDNNAISTGGVTFTAENSIDLGNNFGWNINSGGGTDYYWVNDSGEYNDASHWSATSGGGGGAGIPTINDNVYFDANSFTASGQIVTIVGDASHNANCKDMDWTGALYSPTLDGASTETLNTYGSLIFIPTLTYNFGGPVKFASTSAGNTVTTAGKDFDNNHVYFDGIGGEWTLMDDLVLTDKYLYFFNGTFNTNNNDITAKRFYSNQINTRILNLGSSVFTLTYPGQCFTVENNLLTLDAGTSLIKFTGSSGGMDINGGTSTAFNDVLCENTAGLSVITNDFGSFRKITFNNNGRLNNVMSADTVKFNIDGTISGNLTADYVEVNGIGAFNSSSNIDEAICHDIATFSGSNTFGTLELTEGHTYTFAYNHIQTIETDLIANGTCIDPIYFVSSSPGHQATIQKLSPGTITIDRVQLQDQNAIGTGVTFIANNSVDLGNNFGWVINPVAPQDLYWVGGTGNWSDVSHWAATSGGIGNYCLPTAFDDVHFDANSFYQDNQAVYVDVADVSCADMDWSAATFNPTFASNSSSYNLHISGSLTLNPVMNFSYNGKIYFEEVSKSKASLNITSAGHQYLNHIYFNSENEWILQDDFNIPNHTIYLQQGTLNTNNFDIYCKNFNSNYTNTRGLILGSSTIYVGGTSVGTWLIGGSMFSLDAGTSEIRILNSNAGLTSNSGEILQYNNITLVSPSGKAILNSNDDFTFVEFLGNGEVKGNGSFDEVIFRFDGTINNTNTFGNVYMHANGFLNGSNSYASLFFTPGYTYTLQSGYWQTIEYNLVAIGSCADQITINSSTPGVQGIFNKPSGNEVINFVNLLDNEIMGPGPFEAYNSVDLGNNTGWTIYPEGPKNIYWVGGTGDWLDISHWSFSSGGNGNYCIPGPEDNAIFDANSFNAPGQTVYIDDPAVEFNSMTWTGVTNNPTIIGYAPYFEMYINGSLTLDPNVNFAFEGEIFFQGGGAKDKGSYTLTSAGHQFNNNIYFDGAGQDWTLQDQTDVGTNDIFLVAGTLNTNDQNVYCKRFFSFYTNTRELILGWSKIYVSDDLAFGWDVNGTNMTLDAGNSEIILNSVTSGFRSVFGNNLLYWKVSSPNTSGNALIYTDHSLLLLDIYNVGEITGNGFFGTTRLFDDGVINGSHTFQILHLKPGGEFIFEAGETQTIQDYILMLGFACEPIYIHSNSSGTQANISISLGFPGSYVYVQDMNAIGNNAIDCSQSFDLGNNTNWIFNENSGKDFDFTIMLDGAFNGTDLNTDLIPFMPNAHPYNNPPWYYSTCQTAPVFPADAVDWVLIEIRDAPTIGQATPDYSVAKMAGILLSDGSIVCGDGVSPLRIDVTPTYNFYGVVWHRNHLSIMSAVPLVLSGETYEYNFTTGSGTVYGGVDGHKQLAAGVWGMFAGNANADGDVNQTDISTTWSDEAGGSGYLQSDMNLQGQSNNVDKNDVWLPNNGESSEVPD